MSILGLDVDAEAAKEIARNEHNSCRSTRDAMLEEHSAAYRWLMASLLGINAGALTLVKDAIGSNGYWGIAAGTFFYVGIACALLIAWLGQKGIQSMVGPLSEAVAFWAIVAATGNFVDETYRKIGVKIEESLKQSRWTRLSAMSSFVAFSIGLACLGAAYLHHTGHPGKLDADNLASDKTASIASPKP